VIFFLGGVRLSELILSVIDHQHLSPFSTVATALSFVSVLAVAILSPAEHAKTPRPSMLLSIYLLAAVACSIVRTRSMWRLDYRPLATLASTALALEVVALALESRGKQSEHSQPKDRRSPEEYSGPFSLSLYWWLNGLIRKGYQTVLTLGDLYTLEASRSSERINDKFQRVWKKGAYCQILA
jgi:hypothetical protein